MLNLERTEVENKLKTQVELAVEKANSIVISSEPDLLLATDIVKFIKEKNKQAETERKNLVEPFNAGVKNINSRFKLLTEPLEKAEKTIKDKMLTFQRELERQKREAEEAKRKEVIEFALDIAVKAEESGDLAQANQIMKEVARTEKEEVKIDAVRGENTGALSTITKRWTFEVIDVVALANSRPDLVEAISSLIRKEIASGIREIAGLRIYQEESLTIR